MAEINKDEEKNIIPEFVENPEALQDQINKTEEFAKRNKNILLGVLGVVVAVIAGYFGFQWYVDEQDKKAQTELFPAVFYFEKDSLEKALNGDGNTTMGLEKIANQYGSSPAGKLAKFYAGSAKLKLGKYDEAISYLKDFSTSDLLVQARAHCLVGDAYMQKKEYASAISYYEKASSYKPNEQFTPTYLIKLGLACEKNNDFQGAYNAYKRIVDEFEDAQEVAKAKKYAARAEQLSGKK